MARPLWTPAPDRVARANLTRFMRAAAAQWDESWDGYAALHEWSIREPAKFWSSMWDFGGVIASARGDAIVEHFDRMPGARFFPDAQLNFAANMLRTTGGAPAIVFRGEERVRRTLSFDALRFQVAAFAAALRDMGVRPGERVAAYVPNLPEAIVAALATAAVGGVWSSCSPDFGVQGVLDRFGQIAPRVLVIADGYYYGGRTFDSLTRASQALERLPTVERTVVIPYTR